MSAAQIVADAPDALLSAAAAAERDAQSVALATTPEEVDALNAQFYGAIRYPWPPFCFERVTDPRFWADMLDADLGRRGRPVLPPDGGDVWVAGCGTNQAVITALSFPGARVVGSDLSGASLAVAERNARQLGIANLELREESIHRAGYRGEFDYVVCTGVIHHTADPARALGELAAALRPAGVLQLMVYNRFHRGLTTAFQKAVRTLLPGGGGFEEELALARRFVHRFGGEGPMAPFLASYRDAPDARLADALVQPVEHSYTVESLAAMARAAGLELLAPVPNPHDAAHESLHWEMEMGDPELQAAYDALPDEGRWQVTNLLLMDASPMLWFYLQRAGSPVPRRSTRELCDGFLDGRWAPARATRQVFVGRPGGEYGPAPDQEVPFPARGRGDVRLLVEGVDPGRPLRETLERLGMPTDFRAANRLRVQAASSAFPYLRPA